MRPLSILAFLIATACSGARPAPVAPPSLPAPPALAPALRAALEDTSASGRVYTTKELREPVLGVPGNPMPKLGPERGEAILRFVIDTAGRVEPNTLEAAPGSEPVLAGRLGAALARWRVFPGKRPDGAKVRVLFAMRMTQAEGRATIVGHATSR